MNKNEYLNKFKKELKELPRNVKEDIVREMQGNLEDFDDVEKSLEGHFGSPQQLAQNYTQGIGKKTSPLTKVPTLFSRLMIGAGLVFTLLILLIVAFWWSIKDDRYNYADSDAALHYFEEKPWTQQEAGDILRVENKQSEIVVYWHDKTHISYQCKGKENIISSEATLAIEQAFCVIFLPADGRLTEPAFDVFQTDLILVRPQTSLAIKSVQSSTRVAEGKNRYHYRVIKNRSEFKELLSDADADVTISIDAYQSKIRKYRAD